MFIGLGKKDFYKNENGEYVVRVNQNGTKARVFVNPVYYTWYDEFALPKLNINSVHCQNIFYHKNYRPK
jgi:hypothetical protein